MHSLGGVQQRGDLRGKMEEAYLAGTEYIGTKLLPPLGVTLRAAQYPYLSVTSGSLLRDEVKGRGPSSAYARMQRSYFWQNYDCQDYGIEVPVDDSQAADLSRFFALESSETRLALRQVQLAHERRVSAILFAPATFALTTSAVSYGSGASSLANMDFGLDVDTAKAAIQSRGESSTGLTVAMSFNNFARIRASTKMQNRIRGIASTDTQLPLTRQAMAQALDVKEVLVGNCVYDASKTGSATSSLTAIWGDTYVWVGQSIAGNGAEDYFTGSAGFTLFWNEDSSIFSVESYREEAIRSTIIRARHYVSEKIVNPRAAQLLVTQYGA